MARRRLPAEVHQAKGDPSKIGDDRLSAAVQPSLDLGTAQTVGALTDMTDRQEIEAWLVEFCSKLAFIRQTDSLMVWQLAGAIWEHNQATQEIMDQTGGSLTYEAESYVNAKGSGDDRPTTRLIRMHPGVLVRRRARNDMERLCEKLGLTPGARFSLYDKAVDSREPGSRRGAVKEGDAASSPANYH